MEKYSIKFDIALQPEASEPAEILYSVRKENKIVTELLEVHEQLSHLIIVSEDLSYFDHVHADFSPSNGFFSKKYVFPTAGTYILFADFTPKETGVTQVERYKISVKKGSFEHQQNADSHEFTSNDITIKQINSSEAFTANEDAQLKYRVEDAEDNPVKDIEPFLGAAGHMVIISEDTKTFLHAHPEMSSHGEHQDTPDDHNTHVHKDSLFGPELKFHTKFPSTGTYKVWLEIKRDGKQHRQSFLINVV